MKSLSTSGANFNASYKRLLKDLKNSTSLTKMKSRIERHVQSGEDFPSYAATGRRGNGDCNNSGTVDITDILRAINYLVNECAWGNCYGHECADDPGTSCNPYYPQCEGGGDCVLSELGAIVEQNCDVFYIDGELVPGDGTVNITDLVNIVYFLLGGVTIFGCTDPEANNYDPDATDDNGSCQYDLPEVDPMVSDILIEGQIYGYQKGSGSGYDYEDSYDFSTDIDLEGNPDNGWELYESENTDPQYGPNTVLLIAPHGQEHYRPTKWVGSGNHDDPSAGLYYCDGLYADHTPYCYKDSDYCTSAMMRTLSTFTGASAIVSKYRQEDPNYYHNIGIDRWCCDGTNQGDATTNEYSGNEADPYGGGIFNFGGIQTPAYHPLLLTNEIHPFKAAISNYLESNPNIKLVIDFHGSSTTNNHWDIDFGLMGSNGTHGTTSLSSATIGGDPPTIDYNLLHIMVDTLIEYEIGLCDYICDDGYDDCEVYGDCPGGVTGHGPISYNDFTAGGQDTITHYVNKWHCDDSDCVQAVQLEASAIYRCSSSSNLSDVMKMMRALQAIVIRSNWYFNNADTSRLNKKSTKQSHYMNKDSSWSRPNTPPRRRKQLKTGIVNPLKKRHLDKLNDLIFKKNKE